MANNLRGAITGLLLLAVTCDRYAVVKTTGAGINSFQKATHDFGKDIKIQVCGALSSAVNRVSLVFRGLCMFRGVYWDIFIRGPMYRPGWPGHCVVMELLITSR